MEKSIEVGDQVKLIRIPEWLVHDLPNDEKLEIQSYVGKTGIVSEIDGAGYFWIGFGETLQSDDGALYSGHSFCVPADCLSVVSS